MQRYWTIETGVLLIGHTLKTSAKNVLILLVIKGISETVENEVK